MAWHKEGDRRYYYRYRWQQGRAVRQYVGTSTDSVAQMAATVDEQRRVQKELQSRVWHEEQAQLTSRAIRLLELCQVSDLVARAALLAAGYRQHTRGQWRLRRDYRNQSEVS